LLETSRGRPDPLAFFLPSLLTSGRLAFFFLSKSSRLSQTFCLSVLLSEEAFLADIRPYVQWYGKWHGRFPGFSCFYFIPSVSPRYHSEDAAFCVPFFIHYDSLPFFFAFSVWFFTMATRPASFSSPSQYLCCCLLLHRNLSERDTFPSVVVLGGWGFWVGGGDRFFFSS